MRVKGTRTGRAKRRSEQGQYALEWVVMVLAAVTAATVMLGYVRAAMRASVKSTEMQINSAMMDNRPIGDN